MYGAEAFIFEIVEEVAPDHLLDREQHWINESQCCNSAIGYNIATDASGGTRPGAGRPLELATIRVGAPLMVSQVWRGPDGTNYADLGKGHAKIERIGASRVIIIPQEDGSEIRVLIV